MPCGGGGRGVKRWWTNEHGGTASYGMTKNDLKYDCHMIDQNATKLFTYE